jgi:hypothetical protein
VAALQSTKSPIVPAGKPVDGGGMSAADLAPVYLHAITQYRERSVSDLAALPPLGQPLTERVVFDLKSLAGGGNARAACVLAAKISGCTFWPEMGRKELRQREERLAALKLQGGSDEERTRLEGQIARTRPMLLEIADRCSGYNASPDIKAWKYMLQSALQGLEPAMAQFHSLPMFDPSEIGDSVDAFAAYKTYAGPFIESLAQRGNEYAMFSAQVGYGGPGAFGIDDVWLNVLPKNPGRALAYAYVSRDLLRKRSELFPDAPASTSGGNPTNAVARRESEATLAERHWARQYADQVLAGFDSRAFAPAPKAVTSDESGDGLLDWLEQSCRE